VVDFITVFCSSFVNAKMKELLKRSTIAKSYSKNKSGIFLWITVYIGCREIALCLVEHFILSHPVQ